MNMIYEQGGALVKPLFFDFPNDVNAYSDIGNNYMIGDSLKISFVTDSTDKIFAN